MTGRPRAGSHTWHISPLKPHACSSFLSDETESKGFAAGFFFAELGCQQQNQPTLCSGGVVRHVVACMHAKGAEVLCSILHRTPQWCGGVGLCFLDIIIEAFACANLQVLPRGWDYKFKKEMAAWRCCSYRKTKTGTWMERCLVNKQNNSNRPWDHTLDRWLTAHFGCTVNQPTNRSADSPADGSQ